MLPIVCIIYDLPAPFPNNSVIALTEFFNILLILGTPAAVYFFLDRLVAAIDEVMN